MSKKGRKKRRTLFNSNPMKREWIVNEFVTDSKEILSKIIDNVCRTNNDVDTKISIDIDSEDEEDLVVNDEIDAANQIDIDSDNEEDTEWLDNWSIMINALSNDDILHSLHGCCLNVCTVFKNK